MLDNPNEPVSDLSYFDCIESVMENSKVKTLIVHRAEWIMNCWDFGNQVSFCYVYQVLGEAMAGISQHCKTGGVPAFGESVGVASKALCGLTEAAGQVCVFCIQICFIVWYSILSKMGI